MIYVKRSIMGQLIERFASHDIVGAGAQMAYYILLFIFPLLIFIIAILGYLNLPADNAIYFISMIAPKEAIAFIDKYIEYILTERQANLLMVSLLATFWTASNALNVLIKSMNRAYGVEESRGYIRRKLLAIPFTLLITLSITAALFIPIVGKVLLIWSSTFLQISSILMIYLKYLRWLMAIFTIFNVMIIIYFISPDQNLRFSQIAPGAVLATIAWIGMSMLFSMYFSVFRGYAVVYGSIGAFIILMVWLLWSSIVIIAGGELNAILADRSYQKRRKGSKVAVPMK